LDFCVNKKDFRKRYRPLKAKRHLAESRYRAAKERDEKQPFS